MQLFVTEYQKKNTTVTISNTDLLSQIRKVLRASIGDTLWIQSPRNEAKKIRYEIRIEVWDTTTLEWTIISEQQYETPQEKRSMIIAMPNKWDKIELIVQKLTECNLDQILFWPSERSVIKERNTNKEERLHKIIKEAVEQSRGRTIPTVTFSANIDEHIKNTTLIVFDRTGTRNEEQGTRKQKLVPSPKSHITGLIWPEGGLTTRDYQTFEWTEHATYSLWETVLRTETAAIVGWRLLKNNYIF